MKTLRFSSFLLLVSFLFYNVQATAGTYIQAEYNQLDVESAIEGPGVDGSGFGVRLGYRWVTWGFEVGYNTSSSEMDPYSDSFMTVNKYEVDYTVMTAGFRWWLSRYFDLSFGAASVSGDADLNLSVPLLSYSANGTGDFSTTGYYLGLGLNIPVGTFDLYANYNMYRWSSTQYEGDLASSGFGSDEGYNTLTVGLRANF